MFSPGILKSLLVSPERILYNFLSLMPIVLVAMIKYLDVEQAGILEGHPNYTNWGIITGLLPHWFIRNADMWKVPSNGEKKARRLMQSSREVYPWTSEPPFFAH